MSSIWRRLVTSPRHPSRGWEDLRLRIGEEGWASQTGRHHIGWSLRLNSRRVRWTSIRPATFFGGWHLDRWVSACKSLAVHPTRRRFRLS